MTFLLEIANVNGWTANVNSWTANVNGWITNVNGWIANVNGWTANVSGWTGEKACYLQSLEGHEVLERPSLNGVDLVVHKLAGREKSRGKLTTK